MRHVAGQIIELAIDLLDYLPLPIILDDRQTDDADQHHQQEKDEKVLDAETIAHSILSRIALRIWPLNLRRFAAGVEDVSQTIAQKIQAQQRHT